jgi:uncharacterized protein (AIM24 family)
MSCTSFLYILLEEITYIPNETIWFHAAYGHIQAAIVYLAVFLHELYVLFFKGKSLTVKDVSFLVAGSKVQGV